MISMVATVGGTGQARPELKVFAQNFENNTLCAQYRFPPKKSKYCSRFIDLSSGPPHFHFSLPLVDYNKC